MTKTRLLLTVICLLGLGNAVADNKVDPLVLQRIQPVGMVNVSLDKTESLAEANTTLSSTTSANNPTTDASMVNPSANSNASNSSTNEQTDSSGTLIGNNKKGEETYNKFCHICHAAGIAGAPKLGDKTAWEPRVAQGLGVMLQHVEKGFNAMPPKGTCVDCTTSDLEAAIQYMVSQSGITDIKQ